MRALFLVAAIVVVVAPTQRTGKHLCFVVDVSGSMAGWEITKAIEAFSTYAGQPIDDGELCVYAFDGGFKKLDWHELPDGDHIRKVEAWLSDQQAGGNTNVIPPLIAALAEARSELTVVVVSDGRIHENAEDIAEAIKAAQAKRKTPAVIGVIGVHTPKWKSPELKAIVAGGGYYVFPQGEE